MFTECMSMLIHARTSWKENICTVFAATIYAVLNHFNMHMHKHAYMMHADEWLNTSKHACVMNEWKHARMHGDEWLSTHACV